jgi:hypothetical protein
MQPMTFVDAQLETSYPWSIKVTPQGLKYIQGDASTGFTVDTTSAVNATPHPAPFLDPLVPLAGAEYTDKYRRGYVVDGKYAYLVSLDPPADGFDYYYNEPVTQTANDDLVTVTSSSYVAFGDSPKVPVAPDPFAPSTLINPYAKGAPRQFETALVGIIDDGGPDHYVVWYGTGYNTNFLWKTDATVQGGGSSFTGWDKAPIINPSPPGVSGGVFDVQITDENLVPSLDPPPHLTLLADQTVTPGNTANAVASATDTDPSQTLTYSLDPGAPSGATIDPKTGAFSWAVPASEPSGSYPVTVRVTDNGNPLLSDAKSFTVIVQAASTNTPPILAPIADQMVDEGSPLTLTARATDPGEVLTYSLDPGAPAGAAIDPKTGVFTWTPPRGFATVTVVVRVTDNGSPAQSATQSFQIHVNDVPPHIVLSQTALTPDARFQAVGTIDDPGAGPWTGTIDYNDGAGPQPLTIAPDRTFPIDHRFAGAGPYTAVITVTDSGGLSGTLHLNLSIDRPGGSGSPVPVSPPVITLAQLLAAEHSDDLVVSFSHAMDPATVLNPGSYRLVIPGHGKKKARIIPMIAASYNAKTYQATFQIAGRLTPGTSLQVTVGGAGSPPLTDAFGQVLDGNHDGSSGGGATYLLKVPRPGKTKK